MERGVDLAHAEEDFHRPAVSDHPEGDGRFIRQERIREEAVRFAGLGNPEGTAFAAVSKAEFTDLHSAVKRIAGFDVGDRQGERNGLTAADGNRFADVADSQLRRRQLAEARAEARCFQRDFLRDALALRKRRAARRVCGEPAHPEDAAVREIAEALVGIGEKSAPAVFGFVGCVTVVPVAIRVHFFADGMRRNPVIHPVGVDRIRGEFSAVKRAEQIAGIPADQHADVRTGAVEITLENWQEYLKINQYLSVSYNTNSFGEVTDTYLDFYTILEPKAEYSNVAERWEDLDCIAVEYDMDYCVKDIIYNLDDFSFELIDCVSHPDATVDESSFVRGMTSQIPNGVSICRYRIVDGKVEHDYIHYAKNTEKKGMSFGDPYRECVHIEQNEDGTGFINECPANIQITRIRGTLKYYE